MASTQFLTAAQWPTPSQSVKPQTIPANTMSADAPVFELTPGNDGAVYGQTLAAQAPEFVLNAAPAYLPCSQEFVYSWMCAAPVPEPANCMFNLDDFSEYSDSDCEELVAKKLEHCTSKSVAVSKDAPGPDDARSCGSVSEPDAEAEANEKVYCSRNERVDDWGQESGDEAEKGESCASPVETRSPRSDDEPEEETTSSVGSSGSSAARLDAGSYSTFSVGELLVWRASAEGLQDTSVVCSTIDTVKVLDDAASAIKASDCASEDSWIAQQRLRRSSSSSSDGTTDEDVVRNMKAILNKLTIEKFETLYVQLIGCGIETALHVQYLIEELFEKATTQHHFIDMYADLCSKLNEFFTQHPTLSQDSHQSFRKILLRACQISFERNLTPPSDLDKLDHEDRRLAEMKYKTRMLGNLRFVGALLVRKMLAGKVLLAIIDELLSGPTPEALESLAVLLTVVGPTFDTPAWSYHVALNAVFIQVKKFVQAKSTQPRIRCLLKDVLDLRLAGWKDGKPKKIDGPTTLAVVAEKMAKDEGMSIFQVKILEAQMRAKRRAHIEGDVEMSSFAHDDTAQSAPSSTKPKIDQAAFHEEVKNMLCELRASQNVQDAVKRLAVIVPPFDAQAVEMVELLGKISQEASSDVRKAGFMALADLVLKSQWRDDVMELGLQVFLTDICPDLRADVPGLPQILGEELYPAMARLVSCGVLKASVRDLLLEA